MILLIFCSILCGIVESSKILVTTMEQGKSHTGSFMPLMKRMQKDNHTVALYFNKYREVSYPDIQEELIDLTHLRNPFELSSSGSDWTNDFTFITQIFPFKNGAKGCEYVLKHRREHFDRLVNTDWDIIMTDSLFSVCGYSIASMNKAPHLMFHSSDVESPHGMMKGFARNYAILPPNFMKLNYVDFDPSHFFYRLASAYDWWGSFFGTAVVAPFFMRKSLAPVVPEFSFYEHNRKSSFSFTDMPDYLYPAGPRTNDYFSYGSYCRESKQLTGEFLEFVSNSSSKGTVVIAFGTLVTWGDAPPKKLNAFVKMVNTLSDYRVIWSFNGEQKLELLPHVRLTKWLPQNELLNHNKTVLFISHGGLKSVKEATCAGVPSMFMPMFAEQTRNGWLAKRQGFAKIINKYTFTAESLIGSALELINERQYKESVNFMKSRFLDFPIPTLDEAAHKLNKLLRYGGRMPEWFYPFGINFGFIEYLNVDLVLLAPILILSVLSF